MKIFKRTPLKPDAAIEKLSEIGRSLDDSLASIQATNRWMQDIIDEQCKTATIDLDPLAPPKSKGANGTGRKKIFGTTETGNG